jgi:ribosomal protein L32
MSKKPVPKKQQAKSSTRARWATYVNKMRTRLSEKFVIEACPKTGEPKLRHFASPSGWYRGKQIFTKDKDAGVTTIEA